MGSLETITITLDGMEVSGPPGMSILDLAREANVEIPTLCSDPNLAPIGACRICIVEDERNGALLASCVTPISPGMIINTKSSSVIEHRRNIVKLMLASHPDTCMVCDKGNRCQLRKVAGDLGIGLTDLYKIPQVSTIMDLNSFLERDLTKCILCGKCIRACQELVVEGALEYFERGFIAKPATFGNQPLELSECTFCGTCVAMCPTGALSEKIKLYRSTTGTSAETICPYCSCGCTISIEVKDRQIIRTVPGKGPSVNRGTLCMLGSYGLDFATSQERLTSPLIKINGKLEPTSWETALDAASNGLRKIIDQYGGQSIGVIGSTKCTNEDNYILQKFAWCTLGTNNIDNGSRLNDAARLITLGNNTGVFGATQPVNSLSQSDLILLFGTDPEQTAPVVSYALKRAARFKGAKFILIDPAENSLEYMTDIRLKPLPGTEIALLNSIARTIIDENLYDKDYIKDKIENFNEYQIALHGYSPQIVESLTGVDRDKIEQAGRLIASAKKPMLLLGNHHSDQINQDATTQALLNLFILTGNLGNNRGGIIPILMQNNTLGACDMGTLPEYLPGYIDISDVTLRKQFEARWNINISGKIGLNATDMLQSIGNRIKGLYLMGENPAAWFHNSTEAVEVISKAEFVVVQDIFLSETAKLAHIVLPACAFIEREGTFTNLEGRVQKLKKILEPPQDCLPDWEIVAKLSQKMGNPLAYESIIDIQKEIEELVPIYSGLTELSASNKSFIDTINTRCLNAKNLSSGLYSLLPVRFNQEAKFFAGKYRETSRKLSDFGSGTRINHTLRFKQSRILSG